MWFVKSFGASDKSKSCGEYSLITIAIAISFDGFCPHAGLQLENRFISEK